MVPHFFLLQQDNSAAPSTAVSATSDPIPPGQIFMIEHVSGFFRVGAKFSVDRINVADGSGQQVFLPTHFASEVGNGGGMVGDVRDYQFGSPVRMYVNEGRTVTVRCDAQSAAAITVVVIGQLVPK